MLNFFSFETGENEESRTYEAPVYTDLLKSHLDELLEQDDALGYLCFSRTAGNDVMTALSGTFAKGTISQQKAKMKKLSADGWDILKDYKRQITEGIDGGDNMAVAQLVDEMGNVEKKLLAGLLTQEQIEHLRTIK